MQEKWKNIQGYDGFYQISNLGQVRRTTNIKNKSKINYILKQYIERAGYKSVVLSLRGFHKTFFVHRLVASAFLPNSKNKPIVDHKDFDKKNNKVDNLDWVTQSENCKRAIKAGRLPNNKGEKHGMSKLTEKQVLEIKIRLKTQSGYRIAKDYGVSDQTIYDIKKGKRWKHLK